MTAGILFDFNGVIVDDEPQHCDALIATLGEYGYALDRDAYYREYLGFDDRECFRFTFGRMGRAVDEPALLEAIERKNAHYEHAVRASMRLVPGATEFIESDALYGFQHAIVSGALRRENETASRRVPTEGDPVRVLESFLATTKSTSYYALLQAAADAAGAA